MTDRSASPPPATSAPHSSPSVPDSPSTTGSIPTPHSPSVSSQPSEPVSPIARKFEDNAARLGEALRDVFRFFMRHDAAFLPALTGAFMVLWGVRAMQSPIYQSFGDFWAANRAPVVIALAGLALFFFGCFGSQAALRDLACNAFPATAAARIRTSSGQRQRGGRWTLALQFAGGAILAAGLGLLAYTLLLVKRQPGGLRTAGLFFTSVVLCLAGMILLEARRRRAWLRDAGGLPFASPRSFWRRDSFWLVIFLAAWGFAMSRRLDTRPGFFHGDEAMILQYGRATYFFDEPNRNMSPWGMMYQPYLSGVPRSLLRDAIPERPYWGARLFSLAVACAALAALFVLARAHFGRAAAWIAIVLLASNHVFMAFSRMALNNIDALLLLTCCALAWMAAWRSRRLSMGFMAGVLAGLNLYTYQGGLAIFPILAGALLLECIRLPMGLVRRWRPLAGLTLGVLVALSPALVFYRGHLSSMNYRTGGVSIFQQRNLEDAFKDTGASNLPQMLLRRSWPAIGGVLLWPDTSSNYHYGALPITDRDTAALILLGLAGAAALLRRRRLCALLLVWWGAGMVAGSLLTVAPQPPYSPRILVVFPAAFALAGWAVASLIRRSWRLGEWWIGGPVIFLALALVLSISHRNATHYMRRYLNDMNNPGYLMTPIGFMEFLNTFPRDAHMVYYAGHLDQLNISCLQMFDTAFTRQMFINPDDPIPAPAAAAPRTAYIVKVPGFEPVEKRLREKFPDVKPVSIKNPYKPTVVTHKVWWVPDPPPDAR